MVSIMTLEFSYEELALILWGIWGKIMGGKFDLSFIYPSIICLLRNS
jgi:hypothetical protein